TDVGWLRGIVLKRGANLRDAEVRATLEIHEGFIAPDGFAEVFPRHDFISALDETGESSSGLRLQPDEQALSPQFPCCDVELEQAKSKPSRLHFTHKPVSHSSRRRKAAVSEKTPPERSWRN